MTVGGGYVVRPACVPVCLSVGLVQKQSADYTETPTNRENRLLTFGGDPVMNTYSASPVHFPRHSADTQSVTMRSWRRLSHDAFTSDVSASRLCGDLTLMVELGQIISRHIAICLLMIWPSSTEM